MHQNNNELIRLDEYGIPGSNYYWQNRDKLDFSQKDLVMAGMCDNRVRVHSCVLDSLLLAQRDFADEGFELFVKEGYRSEKLYELIYERKLINDGQVEADRLFNMEEKPHASGMSVDVTLRQEGKEIYFRKGEDGLDAMFVEFYREATDELGKLYQKRQDFLIMTMQRHGFRLGKKKEYWHFDWRPTKPVNYLAN